MTKVIGVSVGSDGTVWCVDSANNIYMRVGSEWKRNTKGKAVEIAVGNMNHVWCRNSEGNIFKLQGTGFDGMWNPDTVASQVVSISVGDDGTVWVANRKGELVKLDSGQWNANAFGKDAVEVTVGNAANVWYRNKTGHIFKLQGTSAFGSWDQDKVASQVESVSVGSDGTIWVSNKPDDLHMKVAGEWKKNDKGKANQISVGKQGLVWCVTAAGAIYHAQAADWATYWTAVAAPKDMPASTTYKIKDGDQLLAILRAKNPGISSTELTKKADQTAKLNGWSGTLADNYGGKATSLKAGDVIILVA